MSSLLCRHAEAAFWMARYVERAESLARVLDVHDTFSRNSQGHANWEALLALYGDNALYEQQHGKVDARRVVHFYLFDLRNPGSVASSLACARDNTRTIRPRISSEIWEHWNTFYNEFRAIDAANLKSPYLFGLCRNIKEQVQRHTGIVEGTMYRDEAWHFYHIGRQLERAAQTTHYLDSRYQDLTPDAVDDVTPVDVSQWTALLRSQAALHGYRQSRHHRITPRGVADFLLFERRFPRSVRGSLRKLAATYANLHESFSLNTDRPSRLSLERLRLRMREKTIDNVIRGDLHVYLDSTQRELYAFSDQLRDEYF